MGACDKEQAVWIACVTRPVIRPVLVLFMIGSGA